MTNIAGPERRLTGTLTVARPCAEAFRLFTPRGEEGWVPGWKPRFPIPQADDTVPGAVFETDGQGHAVTWVVLEREVGRYVRYARVAPGVTAGTVAVALDEAGEGTQVTVTYELTALREAARRELDEFADSFPAFLKSWETAIAESIESG